VFLPKTWREVFTARTYTHVVADEGELDYADLLM
jgi:hypothetical protein